LRWIAADDVQSRNPSARSPRGAWALTVPVTQIREGKHVSHSGIKDIILNAKDLPAMPHVASKVLELAGSPETTANRLQKVIQDDQAMAARILKIANSALYGCSRKIKTLTEAIVMLGFNTIRSLVVTSAARNMYLKEGKTMGLKERLLWEHSIGCAIACRVLVSARHTHFAEEAFLAGLMHDIGKLVLNQYASDVFDEIVQEVYNDGRQFIDVERELLGFDHSEVGALLVAKWKLSPALEEAISQHHSPDSFTEDRLILCYLDMANNLCKREGIGFVETPDLDLTTLPSNRVLKFSELELDNLADRLADTLESEMEIFV
jgi:HD-like signal output (HDOD) protein